jgi:hypothetical protein
MPQPAQSFVFYISYDVFVINCFFQFFVCFESPLSVCLLCWAKYLLNIYLSNTNNFILYKCHKYFTTLCCVRRAGIAQSVKRLVTGWTVRGSIAMGTRFFATVQTGPGVPQLPVQWVPGLFPGVKRPGRDVEHPPHLALRLKKEQ